MSDNGYSMYYIESMQAENAALKQEVDTLRFRVAENVATWLRLRKELDGNIGEIEQLRADNAALLEGLNTIMDKEMMRYQYDTPAYTIARECIAKLGGDRE